MTDHIAQPDRISCCLIGGDTLLTQCGEQLIDAGHRILRIVTDAGSVIAWARGHDIDVIPASSDYSESLRQVSYDYLFAITHLALIPDAAIATAAKGAFNFHDGPLPAYAGLNTPMWALINGETEYGISWHVMATGIDTGDLAVTEPVAISGDDTAVSLNTKCFTSALDSFPRLIDGLVNGNLALRPQNLEQRAYFGRSDHPEALCVLDWSKSAVHTDRLIRALNTGRYENPLGSPKLITEGGAYIVAAGSIRDERAAPGTVLSRDHAELVIACGEQAYAITQLQDPYGSDVPLSSVNVHAGTMLPAPNSAVSEISAAVAKAESVWLRRLLAAEAMTLPYRSAAGKPDTSAEPIIRSIDLPAALHGHSSESIAAAIVAFFGRITGNDSICVAAIGEALQRNSAIAPALLADYGFDTYSIDYEKKASEQLAASAQQFEKNLQRAPWLKDLVARQPSLRSSGFFVEGAALPILINIGAVTGAPPAELKVQVKASGSIELAFSPGAYDPDAVDRMTADLTNWLAQLASNPNRSLAEIDIVSKQERNRLIEGLNATALDYDTKLLMHSKFEHYAMEFPDSIAVIANGQSITYGDLNARANKAAAVLQSIGAGPDTLVGVYVGRSIELMIATLGVLKAGAAYVPLDPAFPADRIELMMEDSAMPIVITHSSLQQSLPRHQAQLLLIDQLDSHRANEMPTGRSASARNLSYVIYTSGSTGKPKGVMLEHRNVVNFFLAMDEVVPGADMPDRTWLAVTSLSFDISVLELFWTLNRGFKVVIHDEGESRQQDLAQKPGRILDMGLFMWGNDDGPGRDKYRLLMEGARFFDQHDFSAVWTPERHFHAFGGPYPNPAVTGAAVAAITEKIKIRAGSCVIPLHHPIRIAEEWSVVDNLSNGRVELAAASGWNPNDFVLKPENHAENKKIMYDQLDQVRQLWRGEKLTFDGPIGPVAVESLPRPVQPELPCWITTAGNPDTWREAGRMGHSVLTHLLGQSVEEVAEKIRIYRNARAEAGHDPQAGRVALMLHTFVGEDTDQVKELVREPMKEYLSSSMRLAMDYAWAFPAFKRPGGDDANPDEVDLKSLSEEEVDTILDFAFERYFETSGLFGTVDRCLDMLTRCGEAGVDEIACLLDFGVETELVLGSLPRIKRVRDAMTTSACTTEAPPQAMSFADLIQTHNITHLQCTPSTARMYLSEEKARKAYGSVPHLLVGGEALPLNLAQEIKSISTGTLSNMYGPTETTIWSMASRISDPVADITIGKPIANTQIYILDKHGKPVPVGIPGELFIAGDGVARGYLNRDELTAERFLPDPFSMEEGSRMYATGDLAMHRSDGAVDYLGRTDFQVKVRGYRIELGEIESRLEALPQVLEAAVMVRAADEGDQRMVCYACMSNGVELDSSELRSALRATLPEYMIPNEFVSVQYMPRTANGKLDRKALASIKPAVVRAVVDDTAPSSDLEKCVADLWRQVLKLDAVGLNENFFDLGGHSLLVVRLHGLLKETLDQSISLTDLYQYTSIRSLCDFLTKGTDNQNVKKSVSRGEQRRALRRRRASQ